MEHKSAFIAIVGSPNVGKSTLINYIVGSKVAIVSDKPQTTRNRIAGVVSGADFQMVFLGTPGVHSPKNKLGEYMVKTAFDSTRDVEAVLFVCDAKHGLGDRDKEILQRLIKGGLPILGAVNKTDAVRKEQSVEAAEALHSAGLDRQFRGSLRAVQVFGSRLPGRGVLTLEQLQRIQQETTIN